MGRGGDGEGMLLIGERESLSLHWQRALVGGPSTHPLIALHAAAPIGRPDGINQMLPSPNNDVAGAHAFSRVSFPGLCVTTNLECATTTPTTTAHDHILVGVRAIMLADESVC